VTPEQRRYLRSKAWKAKREEAIVAAGYRCTVCGKMKLDIRKLQVHHRTYENFGREKPGDLMVLCARCHRRVSKW
jgi:5-methylcytosine-specific restriction endonuclease McrA